MTYKVFINSHQHRQFFIHSWKSPHVQSESIIEFTDEIKNWFKHASVTVPNISHFTHTYDNMRGYYLSFSNKEDAVLFTLRWL